MTETDGLVALIVVPEHPHGALVRSSACGHLAGIREGPSAQQVARIHQLGSHKRRRHKVGVRTARLDRLAGGPIIRRGDNPVSLRFRIGVVRMSERERIASLPEKLALVDLVENQVLNGFRENLRRRGARPS